MFEGDYIKFFKEKPKLFFEISLYITSASYYIPISRFDFLNLVLN